MFGLSAPALFWPLAGRIALLVLLEAAFAIGVKAFRRGAATSRASIWRRAATWIMIAVIYFAFCGAGAATFGVLAAAIAIQALRELVAVLNAGGRPCSAAPAIAASIVYIAAAVAGGAPFVALAALAVGAAALVEGVRTRSLQRALTLFGAASYVGVPLALLVALRASDAGFAAVTWTIAVVAFCDVTSMFGGLAFGRRRLAPALSPSKTIEGTFVGLVGVCVVAALLRFAFPAMPPAVYLVAALVVAASGIAGDLVASLLKRAARVKDFGSALPGHGGVMDRIDSLLVAAPVAWMFFALIV